MSLPFRMLAIPAVLSVFTLQLSGCGEGSNNLSDPQSNSSEVVANCSDNTTQRCTSGQFIDEPVVGLNYECDKIKSVTDAQGFFSCPDNSQVAFYLQGSTSDRRINLGKYRVKPLGDLDGKKLNVLLQITPRDLIGYTNPNVELISSTGKQVANILRLLQGLDSDSYIPDNLVVNRIVISETDKDKLSTLGKDMEISEFAVTGSWESTLQPFLTAINKTLPTAADAIARFNKSLLILQSGVYEVLPFAVAKTSISGEKGYTGMIGFPVGSNSNDKLMEGMVLVVDRDGKSIGLASEWRGVATDTDLSDTVNNSQLQSKLIQRFIIDQAPRFLNPANDNLGFEVNGVVKSDFKFKDPIDKGTLQITQGVMEKGSLSGSAFFYRNVYGLADAESVPSQSLGLWERRDENGVMTFSGTANINKTREVSPFLDPVVWRVADTVETGANPTFPLHLKLTLRNSYSDATCLAQGSKCEVGVMGISILANGNIVSDRDNDCQKVSATSLEDESGTQEFRLGTIAASFKNMGRSFISPIMLVGSWVNSLPDEADPWKKFFGIQIGMTTTAGGPKVKIDVTEAVSKKVAIYDNQAEDSLDAARWYNYVKTFQFIHHEANKPSATPVEETQGAITKIETQACYSPIPKV